MRSVNGENEDRQDIAFLNNLKEDLHVLENSWRKKKPNRKKVLKHFVEILDSILDIARTESLEQFESILSEMRSHLTNSASVEADFEKQPWGPMSEIINLLMQAILEGVVPTSELEACRSRWDGGSASQESANDGPSGDPGHAASPPQAAHEETELSAREEEEMTHAKKADPNKLLQKAQQALLSGNGESAKELALRAAEMIAEQEAEEAARKSKILRADLEVATHLEAEAEETLRHVTEELAEREQEAASLTNRLGENESFLEERKHSHEEIKEQIENVEAELAALKEKHRQLLEQFQEALPARDAADRECVRLNAELEKVKSGIADLQQSSEEAESQLTQTRQQKQEIEAKLEKLLEKIPA